MATTEDRQRHFRRLERMYASGPINRFFQPTLRVGDGEAEITMTVRPEFHHAAHALHGAAYFKMLDDAAFFAANSVCDTFVLTVGFNVVLLRPVADGVITSRGRLVHRSRKLLVGEAELFDERGRTIARGTGTFMPSTIALDEKVGYAEAS